MGGLWSDERDPFITTDYDNARRLVTEAIAEGYVVVGHNLAFDLWVLGIKPKHTDAGYHDTMVVDFLQRLAFDDGGSNPSPYTTLEKLLGRELGGKGDTQLSYKPGVPLTEEQERYLRGDVEATHEVWERQVAAGFPGGVSESSLQVRAMCALNQLERNGLRTDAHQMAVQRKAFQRFRAKAAKALVADGYYQPARTGPRGGEYKAKLCTKPFEELIVVLAKKKAIVLAKTPTGRVKVDANVLLDFLEDPVVAAWKDYKDADRALGFLRSWETGGVVHGRYCYLVRSGRTSSSKPNMQNIPSRGARGDLKKCFIAPEGRVFYELDYGQLELCTFAYLTQGKMLELINADVDLHRFIASKFYKKAAELLTKVERQTGKAPNFGFLGGMGVKKFLTYARGMGVACTEEEGQELRNIFLTHYHEANPWLRDKCEILREYRDVWAGREGAEERKVVRTSEYIGDNKCHCLVPAGDLAWDEGWERAKDIGKRMPWYVVDGLKKQEGSPRLERWLTHRTVTVVGGRTRAPVSYTEERNTRFQGLAANLTKDALARVWQSMPHVMIHAFVHDSLLISVEDNADKEDVVASVAGVMLDAARDWIPGVLVHVEADGPGMSWYDAKNAGSLKF
jgi:DNA polymerase I-like protein with 3'-5' exonuclease and polymerase domains